MTKHTAISVSSLSKNYSLLRQDKPKQEKDDFTALSNVSFEIVKGESVAIVGFNGSGKSTLLKILAGVTKPSSGSVTITGKVASILDIGAGFHPELSGRENIFLNGQLLGFTKKSITPKLEEIVDFSGIGNFINEPVKKYSNGMFLRLAFSIVIHLDFDIYLFDEVLGAGDTEFQQKFQQKLLNLQRSKSKTVIIVSHQIRDFKQAIGRCLYLQSGGLTTFDNLESYFLTLNQTSALADGIRKAGDFADEVTATILNLNPPEIMWQSEIAIQISIQGVKKPTKLGISVKDVYQQTVFESYFNKYLAAHSNAGCTITIPSKFFNNGQYYLDLLFSDLIDQVEIVREILNFKVNYSYQNWEVSKQSWGNTKPDIELVWENINLGNV
ncbi:MAG: ABC-type polysaccharide/polyol phosphate transport system ATPase subunit [Vicingaceae bacterium]|jgi:ABC-type polysaccharide/polyol phosphate transport system ATPase subunit